MPSRVCARHAQRVLGRTIAQRQPYSAHQTRWSSSRPVPQTPEEIEEDVERRLQAIKQQREEEDRQSRELTKKLELDALEAQAAHDAARQTPPVVVKRDEPVQSTASIATATATASTSTSTASRSSEMVTPERSASNPSPNTPNSPSASSTGNRAPKPSQTLAALQTQATIQAQELAQKMQKQIAELRGTLADQRRILGTRAKSEFAQLGGRINHITGYDEVERLKDEVVRREGEIGQLRKAAKAAKLAYEQAVQARSTSQRDVTSLLERKHTWSDADVVNFTALVRSDHTSNNLVHTTSTELETAEQAVDAAFSELMKSILTRYHEEQVWSDKIRNLSTYAGLVAIAANLIVFLTAIVVVEPWKRRRLVQGLEERVEGMMSRMEHVIGEEIERVEVKIGSIQETLATSPVHQPQPPKILPATSIEPTPTLVDSPSVTPTPVAQTLHYLRSQLDRITHPSPERDLAATGIASAMTGAVITGVITLMLRN